MDKQSEQLLKSILGEQGLEKLSKTMYRRDSRTILTPMDMYLPLLAVPRAILSWLSQTIKPMATGEEKEIAYPGLADIKIQVNKTGVNAYTAKFIKGGKIIHSFEDQTLPAFGGHIQNLTEDFEMEDHSMEVPAAMMGLSGIQVPNHPNSDVAINALAEVTRVLGRVIDKLVAENIEHEKEEAMEKKGLDPAASGAPSGHAAPAAPVAPLKPAAQTRNPKKVTFQQIAQQTKGKPKQAQQQNPAMIQHKLETKMATPKSNTQYFRGLLNKAEADKKPIELEFTEEALYTPCPYCHEPEFAKTESGPKYSPCACFFVTSTGKKPFLRLSKTESGYKITFSEIKDPELVEVFVETLKSRLKSKK